jgi:uncharacterized peroxidase-related enzyme
MSRFPLTAEGDASSEVRQIYRDFEHRMGFPGVPDFIRTQGGSLSVLSGTWGLVEHVLLEGNLPRATKELIFVAVAVDRECKYCRDAHAACCRMLGVDDKTIRVVMDGIQGDIPDHIRDILLFAIKCASAPEELNKDDFADLSRQGLDEQQILEVIATASMAVYATIIADATMLESDAMFARM